MRNLTRLRVTRRTTATIVAGLALALPATASASWLSFYGPADLAPHTNAQTSSHQSRYGKAAFWVVTSKCVKMWFRNDGSIVEYSAITECDGDIWDGRNSTSDAWAYCRNTEGVTINIECYTCINDECIF